MHKGEAIRGQKYLSPSSNAKTQNNYTADATRKVKLENRGLQSVIIALITGSLEFTTPQTTLLKTNES